MKGGNKMLNDKWYTFLKWLCLIALPAASLLINGLGQIWGWGDIAEKVTLTISCIATFLGALIGVSTYKYNKDVPK